MNRRKIRVHSPRYDEALLWSAQLHSRQRRKGKTVPYIAHLLAVSSLVWEDGGTEDQAIAGLLHDAIEDAEVSAQEIAERFGEEVAAIVVDCTDTAEGLTGAAKEPWLVRKTRYVASLEHKRETSLLVIAADKAHNARDMVLDAKLLGADSWKRFQGGIEGTAWYLLSVELAIDEPLTVIRSGAETKCLNQLGEAVEEMVQALVHDKVVPYGHPCPRAWVMDFPKRAAAH